MKEYNKNNVSLARTLRRNATKQENRLWYCFLNKYPIRFQRQKPIGNYITDFYCAKARLVVELDGRGHNITEQFEKDIERTKYLESVGISVLRFRNSEVDENFSGVCSFIDKTVKERFKITESANN